MTTQSGYLSLRFVNNMTTSYRNTKQHTIGAAMKAFLRNLTCRNADGDLPIELAACAVVFFLCMAALMHMPG